jgi:hypothetical protein
MKWNYSKIRCEVTAAQEIIVERLKDDIREDGLLLSIDKYRPVRSMGTKEERIHNTLSPYYENNSVWHFEGGLCEALEQELKQANPSNDDIKDALHSAIGIMKVPTNYAARRKSSKVVYNTRFGGISA